MTTIVTFGTSYGVSLLQNYREQGIGQIVGSSRCHDEAFLAAVEKACSVLDEAEMKAALEEVQKQMYDLCLFIPLFEQRGNCVMKSNLTGARAVMRTQQIDVSEVRPEG